MRVKAKSAFELLANSFCTQTAVYKFRVLWNGSSLQWKFRRLKIAGPVKSISSLSSDHNHNNNRLPIPLFTPRFFFPSLSSQSKKLPKRRRNKSESWDFLPSFLPRFCKKIEAKRPLSILGIPFGDKKLKICRLKALCLFLSFWALLLTVCTLCTDLKLHANAFLLSSLSKRRERVKKCLNARANEPHGRPTNKANSKQMVEERRL